MIDLLIAALVILCVWLVSVQIERQERGERERRKLEYWRQVQEERDRRQREREIRARLPRRA